ncbi:MAG: type I secretion system permease/ATPase [Pseudomonadota bacterium]
MTWADAIVKDTRRGVVPIALISGMLNMLLLTSPIYMLQVYDRVLMSAQLATLFWVSMIALVAYIGLGLFDALRSRSLVQLGAWVIQRAAPHAMTASLQDSIRSGDKSGRHLRDLQQVQNFIGGNAITPFFDLPFAPFFIALTFVLHPYIGVLTVAGGIVLFTIALITDRRARAAADQVRNADLEATKVADTFLQGADYIESAGMRDLAVHRYQSASKVYQDRHRKVQSTLAHATGLSKGLRMILQSASLGIGALLVLRGEMTAGGMIAGSILMSRALAPVEQSMNAWRSFKSARDAMTSLRELAQHTEAETERLRLPDPTGRVSAKRVTFVHTGQREPLFSEVTFSAEPGAMLCVVGASGTGKTTLCRILTGVETPVRGRVEIDGAEVRQWNRSQFGEIVGYLPQLSVFYDGTVAQNISHFAEEASDEAIIDAARSVGAHELILQLPDGYATQVGPLGNRLSGGQTQLIGLARANFNEPRILILDEPTAHLDDAGRAGVATFLQRALAKSQTVIVATHDASLVKMCDRILLLNGQTGVVQDRKAEASKQDASPKAPISVSNPAASLAVVRSQKETSGNG